MAIVSCCVLVIMSTCLFQRLIACVHSECVLCHYIIYAFTCSYTLFSSFRYLFDTLSKYVKKIHIKAIFKNLYIGHRRYTYLELKYPLTRSRLGFYSIPGPFFFKRRLNGTKTFEWGTAKL